MSPAPGRKPLRQTTTAGRINRSRAVTRHAATGLLVSLAVLAAVAACQQPPPVVSRIQPPYRPDLLAGCYAMRYGGPAYRSSAWPQDWQTRFAAPQRFAVGPLAPRPGRHTPRVIVIPLSWSGPARPRVIAHVTTDADSMLIGSGLDGDGVAFRLALQGDTLPGVAALSGGKEAFEPVHTVRHVMAVRVHCSTGEPLSLARTRTRR